MIRPLQAGDEIADRPLLYRSASSPFLFLRAARPFVEGFLVSLKPLSQLFSSPYRFIPRERLLRRLPDDVGQRAGLRLVHLQLLLHLDGRRPLSSLVLVVPGRLCLRALRLPGRGPAARRLPRREHVLGRRADHPALPADAHARAAQHLCGDDRAGRRLPDPLGDLAAAHLHDAHPEGAATRRPTSTAPAISTRCGA